MYNFACAISVGTLYFQLTYDTSLPMFTVSIKASFEFSVHLVVWTAIHHAHARCFHARVRGQRPVGACDVALDRSQYIVLQDAIAELVEAHAPHSIYLVCRFIVAYVLVSRYYVASNIKL
jgi:hypothetical protein